MTTPTDTTAATTPLGTAAPAAPAELEAARLLLRRMGVSPADLLHTDPPSTDEPTPADDSTPSTSSRSPVVVPTFAAYVPVVAAASASGARTTYGPYWDRLVHTWGERTIDAPTPSELRHLTEQVRADAVRRRNGRGGRSAAEHMVAALRCLYRQAVADGILAEADDPARKVDKPRRQPSPRHALSRQRLSEITQTVATTGNDPTLDSLLIRLHTETACRRGGALALRVVDLVPGQCLIRLHEKGDTVRWQPVSPTLIAHLQQHAAERGSASEGKLLRYATGKPLTYRRYDHLWVRLGRHLPWIATQQVSTHWLRHTTLTWVERHFGYAIARAYARHAETNGDTRSTATYVRAGLPEVAAALAALSGEPHPLADPHLADENGW